MRYRSVKKWEHLSDFERDKIKKAMDYVRKNFNTCRPCRAGWDFQNDQKTYKFCPYCGKKTTDENLYDYLSGKKEIEVKVKA